MKKISVIIVNYNVCHFLEQALRAVQKAALLIDTEIIVVDNNSVDKSLEMLKDKFPEVILIANKQNTGFSKANNQGIKIAKGEYILLLNPDTVIEEDTLFKCVHFMDQHPEAGGLGVKMLDGKGEFLPESKRGLPTPWVAFSKVFGLAALMPKSKLFGRYHLGYLDKDEINEVDILSGAFMLMRKTTLDKVGLLDEEYFMYGEDIDLSYRIIKGGYKNYYFPETRIIHYKGESTKKTSINYVFIFYRAMIIFANHHFSSSNAGLFSFVINFAIYIRAFFDIAIRFVKRAYLPVLDMLSIFIGMDFLKSYWEINHKHSLGLYPIEFMHQAVPAYIIIWLGSIYLSGCYDKGGLKLLKVFQAVLIGTLMISSITNFIDSYRFSKALVVLGGIYTVLSFIGIRLILHYIKFGNIKLGQQVDKKIILLGDNGEAMRVYQLLVASGMKSAIAGIVGVKDCQFELDHDLYLGKIEQLDEIVKIYEVNELIFCSKDLPANVIIELMTQLDSTKIDYKIVPDESNYVIGSNSKDKAGDLYTVDIQLKLMSKVSRRNKRILDLFSSLCFLILFPVLVFIVKKPLGFFTNIVNVLIGKKSWVGLKFNDKSLTKHVKAGVLNPSSYLSSSIIDESTAKRLDMIYAKDYETTSDINIISRSLMYLGQ
ncbi:MAG: hypothetical protein RL711_985 [Bacteroidota bacterium]